MGVSTSLRRLWDGARRLPRGGVIAVFCGFLLHLSLGTLYTFGNLTTYLTSYLHVRLGQDVDYGDTLWVSTMQSLAEGPGVLLGSICFRRFGPRRTIFVGGVLCSAGMGLTCLAVQSSFVSTMLAYGLLGGFGIGLVYTSPLLTGYEWFPHNHGAVSGMVVGGYGLGGIIFTSVQTGYLNPDNVSPEDDGYFHDEELLDRVPSVFLVQAAICAGLQLCGVFGVRLPPKECHETPSEHTVANIETAASDGEAALDTDSSPPVLPDAEDESADEDPKAWRKYLLRREHIQLTLTYIMNAWGMITMNSFWKAFGQTFIQDDHFLAMVGVGSSVFNMLGRLVWGLMCDASGYKPTMVVISGLLAAMLFTNPVTSLVGRAMFLIWVWGTFFCVGGTFSVVVTGTAATFGVQHAGYLYGVTFLTAAVSSLIISPIDDAVLDRWGYPTTYLFGGGFVCISLIATLTFRPQRLANQRRSAAVSG